MSLINDALKRATQTTKRDPNEAPDMQPTQSRSSNRSGGLGMTVILICFVVAGAATLGVWAYWNKKYKQPGADEQARAAAKAGSTTNAAKASATGVLPANAAQAKTNLAANPGPGATAGAAGSKTNNNPIARAANTLNKVQALNHEGEKTADAMRTAPPVAPVSPAAATTPAPKPVAPSTTVQTAAPTAASSAQPPSHPAPTAAVPTTTPAPAAAPALKLQAIFFEQNNPIAIISGKRARLGDEVGGYKVIDIKRQGVRLQKGAETQELILK